MSIRDEVLPELYEARAIMGEEEMRPYKVDLFIDRFDGSYDLTPLTEAGGQYAKLVWTHDEDNPGNAGPEDTVVYGPLTPSFPGGGTDLSALISEVDSGSARYLLITGPRHPDGAKYRITNVDSQKALRYMIRAQSEGMGLQGYTQAAG